MDIELLLVLIVVGAIIVGAIFYDSYRKKARQSDNSDELDQDAFDEMMQTRDSGGFDFDGVGLSRIIGDDDFTTLDEPMIATRDDDFPGEENITASRDTDLEDRQATGQEESRQQTPEQQDPELIITLSVLSRSEDGFVGDKLLHCMLSRGLRFGEMNIFHRHKNTSGNGVVQFSLANALKPGIFDLDDMDSFKTRGVTLFMMLPGPKEPLKSFKLMLETAKHLASELDGQVVDSSRSVLTKQTIQHFNEQIQDFQRRKLSKQ
ncbi:MAG: cell division protein ZipA [Gammaproteobacteria bacterium]|nr:cell division protein ZipA [Gammaproteobacteria bacterium]